MDSEQATEPKEMRLPKQSEEEQESSEHKAVKQWNSRVGASKEKFDKDFKRMKLNAAFMAGYQWPGQKSLDYPKIVVNIVLNLINSIASQLYARNPKVSVERRKTLDFEVWDERIESLQAAQGEMAKPLMGFSQQEIVPQLHAKAQASLLLRDVQMGQQWRKQVDRVAATLETVDAWMVANQQPSYKEQLKDLVLTALICYVGYERIDFARTYEGSIEKTDIESTIEDRQKRLTFLLRQLKEEKIEKDGPQMEEIKQLQASIEQSAQNHDFNNVHERLCWGYPQPWNIIVDPDCTNLCNFIGADWVCEEIFVPVDTVNAYFELDDERKVKVGGQGEAKAYGFSGADFNQSSTGDDQAGLNKPRVLLRHIQQLSTKSHFYTVDGHKKYVMEPEPVSPETNYFWKWRPLVFNRIRACEGETPVSVYGPSHVDVLRDVQREWNRCSESLRKHRQNNLPKFFFLANLIEQGDIERLANAEDSEFVKISSLSPGQRIEDVLREYKGSSFSPEMHDTNYQARDISMTVTGQEAEPAPQNHKVTATAAHIEEQKRISSLSSNADDLDEFLSGSAAQRGEILLRDLSPETAKRIAGRGAVWPQDPAIRQEFIQALTLTIKAASSGRPNQALRVSNMERLAPLYSAAGGNPKFLLRQIVHAMDETLDESEAFPMVAPQAQPGAAPQQPHPGQGPARQTPQALHNGGAALKA